jgi:L-alanine-DL-glutamate epimerase-like enolase superfamily enzyme
VSLPKRNDRLLLEHRPLRLALRHPWTIARGTSLDKTNVLVRLRGPDGIVGLGEAAPSARYGEDAATVAAALDRIVSRLPTDPSAGGIASLDALQAMGPADPAARAALDIAVHDREGWRAGVSVGRLLGAPARPLPPTSMSIGHDTIAMMQEKARAAASFPFLKIKLGVGDDRRIVEAIRAVATQPLLVDANEAWRDADEAIAMIRWLEGMGVLLVEQPCPAADHDLARAVRRRATLPIFADEAVRTAADVPGLREAYDGINVKVQKAGGLRPALRTIEAARAAGLQVMIGCMVETSLGITAAAHLAPLCDRADLDGALLLADDPFRGAVIEDGRIALPPGPGLGVTGFY